ncbi:hypothetical protein HWC07_gp129 [Pantoea phage vB_PagM_LIET2]|uniref:Uncharacterized protein n=1 Tax=Pantoea phage vB_PagM_LIET2 TaxID=2508071 RepID=A0A411AW97_9CAUD|nr:hypothetical protein HWC07_gp129 [Pantoea phage vB_PagM_LIET2]QAX92381.1 hypothetical protein LIET2_gp129 [Pantoea phage vB_PagM_LIET2]
MEYIRVTIARERVKSGQLVRLNGLSYTASAQRNGYLYLWRAVPGGIAIDRDCTRTNASLVELLVDPRDVAKYN